MNHGSAIENYLLLLGEELSRKRKIGRLQNGRILAETEDHLRESAVVLQRGGLPADEAERKAVESFGEASSLARDLVELDREGVVGMLRTAIAFLAGMTSLAALVTIYFAFKVPEDTVWIPALKLGLGGAILFQGVVTVLHVIWSKIPLAVVKLGAAGLLIMGLLITAVSSYNALIGSDPEYWAVLLGGFLIAQAVGTLIDLHRLSRIVA